MFRSPLKVTDGYPANRLPALLLDAVHDVQHLTKAPTPLVAASALGALATACQGLADFWHPTLRKAMPISLNLITVAGSGERKSAADHFFFEPVHLIDRALRIQHTEALQAYKAGLVIWNSKVAGLEGRLGNETKAGHNTTALEEMLRQLYHERPLDPQRMRLALSDITPAALISELALNPCTAVLHSNEAADLIKGRTMSNLPLLNKAWDGQPLECDRKDERQSNWAEGARLTTSLAVQPEAFKHMCDVKGSHVRDIGYFARALIAFPASTAGQRPIHAFDGQGSLPQGIATFQSMITTLLERALERHNQREPRKLLAFDSRARDRWVAFFNEVEANLGPSGGRLHPIKDFAAKAAEHVARLAAIFEIAQGDSETISQDSVERAIDVVSWYLGEFFRLFGKTNAENCIQQHADNILSWVQNRIGFAGINGINQFSRRQIQQKGPHASRSPEVLNLALNHLLLRGDIVRPFNNPKAFSLATRKKLEPQLFRKSLGDVLKEAAGLSDHRHGIFYDQ